MSNVKITELTALTSPETTDVLPIVDVDTDVTKKVSVGEIVGKISGDVTVGTDGTAAITGGVIVDADVKSNAAIAGTKIDPDFGSQAVETTGVINAGSGTEGAPAITVGTADNGLYSPGTDQVAISTNGTERVEFGASEVVFNDGGGNYDFRIEGDTNSSLFFVDASADAVGIGTTPLAKFHVNTNTNENMHFTSAGSGDQRISALNDANNATVQLSLQASPLLFRGSGGVEVGRWDTSGRFLVGTSSARSNLNGTAPFQVETLANTANNGITIINNSTSSFTPRLRLGLSKGGSIGSNTIVSDGNGLGTIQFVGNDGTNFVLAATILGEVDGTPGTNDMPGRLVFSTTESGNSSPTERMRITNDGYVLFFTTSVGVSSDGVKINDSGQIRASNTDDNALFLNRNGTDGAIAAFRKDNTGVGSITVDASSTTYATSSDYRLKENVVPLTGAADRLSQLQVHRFNFIADPDKTVDGFIAHEAQAVVPECVTGEKDEVDDEGNPVYQGIDQSKIVPLVVAALQEALAEIETLKARLADAGIS